jgi:hypothetical protein
MIVWAAGVAIKISTLHFSKRFERRQIVAAMNHLTRVLVRSYLTSCAMEMIERLTLAARI